MTETKNAERPAPDDLLVDIADYALDLSIGSDEAYDTARLCLMDSIGCMFLALQFPACVRRIGPIVPGATLAGGARVPGTDLELDPVQAAFNIGTLVRWLDYNDTWLAAEWGHPSDNLGGILALADYLARREEALPPLNVRDILTAMIQAHEIQGVLALDNAFNRVGLDHVILVRVATTAVATRMLGGTREQIINAVSNAWLDGGALRAYRHAPNAGPRKSWAAGDATSRGVRHAIMAIHGETGYPAALSATTWGFFDALFGKKPITLGRDFGCYVMEHVLFKVKYPAEFHAQTAVEAAASLYAQVRGRWDQIQQIVIETQEPAVRIIDKTGPLANPADRDHCLQYMVAIPLLFGDLKAEHYEAEVAADSRIDALRSKMVVKENPAYSRDYLDPDKRSIANAIQIFFADGSSTTRVEVEYPIGHRRRRDEARPLLRQKFRQNLLTKLPAARVDAILGLFDDQVALEGTDAVGFMGLFTGQALRNAGR